MTLLTLGLLMEKKKHNMRNFGKTIGGEDKRKKGFEELAKFDSIGRRRLEGPGKIEKHLQCCIGEWR